MKKLLLRLIRYLNPLDHLGDTHYSFIFPLVTTVSAYILSEALAYLELHDPMAVGSYAIFLSVGLIIYFAFREGLLGGMVTTIITIFYYIYIIATRHYSGGALRAGLETTAILAGIFLVLAGVIGWLKQNIDKLIEREADEKRRLEEILQQLPIGVLVTDATGKLTHQNKRFAKIMGLKIPDDFEFGKKVLLKSSRNNILVEPSDSPLMEVLQSKKAVEDRDFIVDKKDGNKAYVQVSASIIRNKRGEVIAATEIINDISRQKELESLKDEFISIASHELKTPLTTIKGFTEILVTQSKKDHLRSYTNFLTKMNYQVDRITALVNDLLDVSKIQSGKLELSKEEIKFGSFLKETVEDLQQVIPTHKIVLKNGTNGQIVSADKYRLNQVLTNLITNAAKYSPNAKKIVVTSTASKKYITLNVQDYGIGISEKDMAYVFDRFFQAQSTQRQSASGLGLGLYITSEIVNKHGGKIWAESKEGKGSTFSFNLPVN
jgi:PAS domain S-box-containing protein